MTKFSKLSKNEQIEFLTYLKDYYIEYRESLDFPNMQFGVEIEAVPSNVSNMEEVINILKKDENVGDCRNAQKSKIDYSKGLWMLQKEKTIEDDGGIEVSSPILTSSKVCFDELKKMCEILSENGYGVNNRCAAHVHVSTPEIEEPESIINLMKIYAVYEDVLFKFGHGEF